MSTEYFVAIDMPMHRFEIRCENQAAMLRLAAHAGELYRAAMADPNYRSVFQIQGDHGMISVQPTCILHIEPFVRESFKHDWSEPVLLRGSVPNPQILGEEIIRLPPRERQPKSRRSIFRRLTDHRRDEEE